MGFKKKKWEIDSFIRISIYIDGFDYRLFIAQVRQYYDYSEHVQYFLKL